MFGNLGTIWAEIGVNTKKLDAGVAAAELKLAKANTTVSSFGHQLTAQSTKLLAVGGLMAGAVLGVGIATVKMAKDFEVSMRNVNSIARMSEAEFAKMSDEVLDLSTKMPQSAKVLADGLYDIASSGFSGAEGMKVLKASAEAASAGLTETATSAKGITAVLNAYGYSADKATYVSDTMFRTVDKGVITFEELSSSIGSVVGTANLADISFNELSGALGYMTIKGIGAEESTTALNRLILSIIDPSEKLAEVLRNAGYESGEMALKQLGLVGVMELLEKASGGSLTELQAMVPEMRALKAAGALLGSGIDSLNTYMSDFKDTTGATNIALAEQSKSLDYNLQILRNNISAVGIAIGSELIPSVTKYTQKLADYISENKEAIASNILLAGKIIGLSGSVLILTGLIGKLRAILMTTTGWIGFTVAASIALNTALTSQVEKLKEANTGWSNFAKTLIESTFLWTGIASKIKDINVFREAIRLAKEGLISEEEHQRIVEQSKSYGDLLKNTKALVEEKELLTSGIYDSLEAYKSAQTYIKNYSDELPNATNEMAFLIQQLQDGEISTEAFTLAIEELRKETDNGRKDIEDSSGAYNDFADKQELARIKVEAHTKAQKEAGGIIDNTTGDMEEQAKTVDELRQEFNDLINTIFGITNAENDLQESEWALEDAQKAVTEAIKEHGEGSREVEQAVNDYERELQNNISILQELYTEEGLSIERKEELKKKLYELLEQAKETSGLSQEQFIEMATQFGLSSNEIISMAQDMGYELDEATKERIAEIDADTSEADKKIKEVDKKLNELDGKTVTVKINATGNVVGASWLKPATGGIITSYGLKKAGGGIIGQDMPNMSIMPRAASGYMIPQTGREVPIIAHEGEIILNTSQQKNLAEAIWGVANGRNQSGGGISIGNLNVISPAGTPSEIARETKMQLKLLGMEAQLR